MIMFVKMTEKWIGKEFNYDDDGDLQEMRIHTNNGSVVAIAEDTETFIMEMGLNFSDIEMVE